MGSCVQCGATSTTGGLCVPHAQALAGCQDITAEQIQSVEVREPLAHLIDQWGCTHAVGRTFSVGRSTECDLSVLHHSVSALHAEITVTESGIHVRDRGSLNGTLVNGERVRGGRLFEGDVVQFGDVCFYVSTRQLPAIASDGGTGRTVPSRADELGFGALIQAGDRVVELIERGEGGGIARHLGGEIDFGRLEFGLLRLLVDRRRDQDDPARAFVPSGELAEALEFRSVAADGENVRELVRRVRKKLKTAGVADLIESRKGAGYRFAWPLKNSR